jgi:flagellar motor switch protein FliN/FliY
MGAMSAGHVLTLAALGEVEVAITVTLGSSRCTVSDVLAFAEGTIVMLGASADAPVDLQVNGVTVATGDIVELADGALAVEIRDVRAIAQKAEDLV